MEEEHAISDHRNQRIPTLKSRLHASSSHLAFSTVSASWKNPRAEAIFFLLRSRMLAVCRTASLFKFGSVISSGPHASFERSRSEAFLEAISSTIIMIQTLIENINEGCDDLDDITVEERYIICASRTDDCQNKNINNPQSPSNGSSFLLRFKSTI